MARWRCLTVAGAPACITDHSCSEEEGNIDAWSKRSTLGIGVLATNSEGRHHKQAPPGEMLRADSRAPSQGAWQAGLTIARKASCVKMAGN